MEKNLADLFGSSAKVKILKLLLNNPKERFSVAKIAEVTKVTKVETRRYVRGFLKMGLIKIVKHDQKEKASKN